MNAKVNSIHRNYYCQVFSNKYCFVEVYPMKKKPDCHEALEIFVKGYGAPDSMIFDSSQEQVIPGTKFQSNFRKYGIHGHTSEMEISNQNPAEGVIWELRKKWYRENFRTYFPRQLWSYGYPYIAKILQLMARQAGRLQGWNSIDLMTEETPNLSGT